MEVGWRLGVGREGRGGIGRNRPSNGIQYRALMLLIIVRAPGVPNATQGPGNIIASSVAWAVAPGRYSISRFESMRLHYARTGLVPPPPTFFQSPVPPGGRLGFSDPTIIRRTSDKPILAGGSETRLTPLPCDLR
jgi:hypothetical protein